MYTALRAPTISNYRPRKVTTQNVAKQALVIKPKNPHRNRTDHVKVNCVKSPTKVSQNQHCEVMLRVWLSTNSASHWELNIENTHLDHAQYYLLGASSALSSHVCSRTYICGCESPIPAKTAVESLYLLPYTKIMGD
ncbi:hypothetical protein, unlikely [Trypanosoma congolense IL3000]|uniref:Uncharacterized protein n=1 Tax=Trypanosoma congolense (strain IL3000) TaxID=1068625 RepID=F9WI10_TRYCI|nr:hypothetical protein, unlikely [Trypanosoma congolense IL3000]